MSEPEDDRLPVDGGSAIFRTLVESSIDVIEALDEAGAILYVTPSVKERWGYQPDELVGTSSLDLLHPEDRPVWTEVLARAKTSPGLTMPPVTVRIRYRNGSWGQLERSVRALDEQASGAACVVNSHDITELRQTNAALLESENQFRALAENSITGICLMQDGVFQYVNPRFAEIYGYDIHEMIGMPWEEIVFEDDRSLVRESIRKREAGETDFVLYEYRAISKDKSIIHVEVYGSRATYNGRPAVLGTVLDVTARKKLEQALSESEAKFKNLAEKSMVGIYMLQDEFITYANPRLAEIYGYELDEIIGMRWKEVIHPLDLPLVAANIRKREAGELDAIHYEFRGLKKNGDLIYVDTYGTNVRYQGRLTAIGTQLDITDRKHLEQALLESEGKFKVLAEKSLVGIYLIQDEVFKYTNPRFAEIFGYSSYEPTGKRWEELVFHQDIPLVKENIRKRDSGEADAIHYDFRGLSKDGTIKYIDLYGARILYQGRPAVMGSLLDITDRKLLEQALRKSEEQYRLLAENMNDLIWIADPHSRKYLYASPSVERLLGYSREEFMNTPLEKILTPASLTLARENLTKVMESVAAGRPVDTPPLELEYVQKDGATIWTDVVYSLIFNDSGAVAAVQGVTRDITKRKQADEELARKAAELARSNAELEQFAYIASHDLQEPLRMVASFTELLARRYKGKLDSDADEFIAFAVDGANRMKQLINDLLAYSRVGTKAKPFAPTDCRDVFERALDNLTLTIQEHGATVKAGHLPTVMADAVQLTQLFQNLIANAVKFHGPEPPLIVVMAEKHDDEWVFSVQDNGIGIDSPFFERVFAVFQRLHGQKDYPGTGMGLAICRKIVERHGGRIWVESELGKGATFYFTMPSRGDCLA